MRLTVLLLLLSAQTTFAQDLPRIHLLYQSPNGSIFDRQCPQFMKAEVKPERIRETVMRLYEFQSLWDQEGPRYLATAIKEVGLPFPYREMQAYLTVCPVGSMSDPLLVNVRNFLSDADNPLPTWSFAFLVYHELMHQYIRPVQPESRLIKKYAAEASSTQNHLHVLALEKFALLKLGKEAELKSWDADYRTGWFAQFAPTYKRAWEIVNDVEGYEAFLNELKALPKSGR